MPTGKGSYGRQVGRPKKKKDVNVPGEQKRAYKGYVDHMVSMAEGRFNKMMKEIKARRRVPHKSKIGWTLKD